MTSSYRVRIHLAEILHEHRLSQRQLAEAAHMRLATLNAIYNERVEGVSFSTLADLIGGLERLGVQVSVGDLLDAQPVPVEMDPETSAWEAANLTPLLEPFDWGGADPETLGQSVRHLPGGGLLVEERA